MCIVCFPPMRRSGFVFSFGSGFVGQLGLGNEYYSPTPKLVKALADMNVTAKSISCGTYHVAMISSSDELYVQIWRVFSLAQMYAQTPGSLFIIRAYNLINWCFILLFFIRVMNRYTWGQNNFNCLGRVTDTDFTAEPGHVKVFNVIVDRNPRGKVHCSTLLCMK